MRNQMKYQDALGPDYEFLKNRGYSDERIIQSASKPGGQDFPFHMGFWEQFVESAHW